MGFFLYSLVFLYFLLALWKPRKAVLFLPLFFPAYLLSFEIKGVPFTLIEAFIDVTFLVWIGRFVFEKIFGQTKSSLLLLFYSFRLRFKFLSFKSRKNNHDNRNFWIAVCFIVLGALISTFIVPKMVVLADGNTIFYGQRVALGILKGWIITPLLMLFLFWKTLQSKEELKQLLEMYVVSSVFLSLWALFQVLTGQYLTPDMRASGPFLSANYLALYITPALTYVVIALKEFFVGKLGWSLKNAFLPSAFLLLLIALFFTKSYAAMMAFVVSILFYFFFETNFAKRFREIFQWKWVVLFVGLLVLFLGGLFLLDPKKWMLFFEFSQRTSSGVRVQIYTIATQLIRENPLKGIGLGQFPAVYQLQGPRILGQDPYEWNMLHPHNIFLAFWLNLGLVGLVGFGWIIVLCARKVLAYLSTLSTQHGWTLSRMRVVGFSLLLVILIHGLFDTSFFKNDLALLFWLIITIILAPVSK